MDKYDSAVEFLTQRPDKISSVWAEPGSTAAGCLFEFAGDFRSCGCLTQVRNETRDAATPELTAMIRADNRIPRHVQDITVEMLPVFAEWQRKLDTLLQRNP